MPGAHNIGAAISGPELRADKLRTWGFFLIVGWTEQIQKKGMPGVRTRVRHSTSSIHFHRAVAAVPWSSSHTGSRGLSGPPNSKCQSRLQWRDCQSLYVWEKIKQGVSRPGGFQTGGFPKPGGFSVFQNSKDLPVLKVVRRAIHYGKKNRYGNSKTLRRVLISPSRPSLETKNRRKSKNASIKKVPQRSLTVRLRPQPQGAVGTSGGLILRGFWAVSCLFLRGFWGTCGGDPPRFVLSQPRGEGGIAYRGSSCLLEGAALYGGITERVSPKVTQAGSCGRPLHNNLGCATRRMRQTFRGAFKLAHQNCTIAIPSHFHGDGAKSPEILQKAWVLGSEIASRNRRSLATFHRTLKSQCSIALSCLGNRCDFWGLRWASQSQIAKVAAISVRWGRSGRPTHAEWQLSLPLSTGSSLTNLVRRRLLNLAGKSCGQTASLISNVYPGRCNISKQDHLTI